MVHPGLGLGKHKKAAIISILISIVLLSAGFFIVLSNNIETVRERCGKIAENEAGHIITTVSGIMARTLTLVTLVQDHEGDIAFFDRIAGNIYEAVLKDTGVALKNVAIAPDGVVAAVYPLAGNEKLLGFNFLDMSREGNKEAKEAFEKGEMTLTNPFELVQGGIGMGGRAPVLLNRGGKKILWGLVTVTIDFENLLKVLQLDRLKALGMDYELSCIDSKGTARVLDRRGSPGSEAVRVRFGVRNLIWELAVSPQDGWYSDITVALGSILILVISVFVGAFVNMFITLRETNAQLRRLSNTDRLTACFNRRAYENDLALFSETPQERDFVCATIDINGLKIVNDTKGHVAGDELIVGTAECLKKCFASCGKVYRMGGDEFTILFLADAYHLAALQQALQTATAGWKGQYSDKLSLAVGYAAQAELPEIPIGKLVKIADQRMYENKRRYYEETGHDRRNAKAGTQR